MRTVPPPAAATPSVNAARAAPAAATPTVPLRQDARTIGLIGLAHGTSHFFQMLLPSLFPLLIRDFGFSYAELGLLVTTFFVISGIGQALAGFLVDRIGARPVLFAALSFFMLSAVATSLAQSYEGFMLAVVLAGLGNSPFHPADFTILNKRVSGARLGHAFSVHGISGNLGWAASPIFLAGLTAATGSWRVAAAAAALWALFVIVLLVWQRQAIDDRPIGETTGGAADTTAVGAADDAGKPDAVQPSVVTPGSVRRGAGELSAEKLSATTATATATAAVASSAAAAAQQPAAHALAFLRLPSVWLCFMFFFWSTCALCAVQSFASPALQQMFALPLTTASLVITGFMLCGAAGMVAGGFMALRAARLERVIGLCLMASAALLSLVATGVLPGALAAVVVALAGIGIGLAAPSRDMLIKRASPPGATGRVYGTVYSGLDLGFAVSAPVFGALMDRGMPSGVFFGAALALAMGVVSAAWLGTAVRRRSLSARVSLSASA